MRKGRWEGEREEASFPSSHHPPRVCYFSIIAVFWDTELEPLSRREGVPHFCSVNFVFLHCSAGFPRQVTFCHEFQGRLC